MGSFNWIIVENSCPNCYTETLIRCQTHVASDFDGDDTGRFCGREYQLGDLMSWWPRQHKKFDCWRNNSSRIGGIVDSEYDEEACYAKCQSCTAELCVVIRFHENRPTVVLEVRKEEDWPEQYYR